eukprot:CAMPEP_0197614348 /NCGR_PEP_ID=MMETSP1326-20131121/59480_1 /TAXON_ID=1155430 /ORGANISM="Genus nov. species nov., Strain RCC2288" /LENGTH=278 /DNA_ID=CAMNT_0043183219 /DNA_START=33 /DNA_END=869 /DNA_ORIENTATION=-
MGTGPYAQSARRPAADISNVNVDNNHNNGGSNYGGANGHSNGNGNSNGFQGGRPSYSATRNAPFENSYTDPALMKREVSGRGGGFHGGAGLHQGDRSWQHVESPWEAEESVPEVDRSNKGIRIVGQPKAESSFDDTEKRSYAQVRASQLHHTIMSRAVSKEMSYFAYCLTPPHLLHTSTPPHLHTSTPPHLHTSTPPHLHTSTHPHIHTSIPPHPPPPPHSPPPPHLPPIPPPPPHLCDSHLHSRVARLFSQELISQMNEQKLSRCLEEANGGAHGAG